jgi:hypothetical protein
MKNIFCLLFCTLIFSPLTWASPAQEIPKSIAPKVRAPMGRINFIWEAVSGASAYELELLSEDHTIVYLGAADLSATTFSFPANGQLQIGVPYDWHVRSQFPDGHKSDWSPYEKFVLYETAMAPEALAPFGNVHLVAPWLEWTQVEASTGYEVELWQSQPQQQVGTYIVSGDTKLGFKKPLKINTPYSWRVRAIFQDGTKSAWTDFLDFTLTAKKWDGEITFLRARSLAPLSFELKWTPLKNTSNITYKVIMRSYQNSATTVGTNLTTAGDSLIVGASEGLLPKMQYAWFVIAFDASGTRIGQSAKGGFTTR